MQRLHNAENEFPNGRFSDLKHISLPHFITISRTTAATHKAHFPATLHHNQSHYSSYTQTLHAAVPQAL
jgi:hypothetical protein